jgi:hypothetical protein
VAALSVAAAGSWLAAPAPVRPQEAAVAYASVPRLEAEEAAVAAQPDVAPAEGARRVLDAAELPEVEAAAREPSAAAEAREASAGPAEGVAVQPDVGEVAEAQPSAGLAALPSAAAAVLSSPRPAPAPGRKAAGRCSAPALRRLRIASPKARSWQAAEVEGCS